MAYTAYRTWTTGEIVTAALMNEQVRDNGLLTAPAIMTGAGDLIYSSAANTPTRLAKSTSSTRVLTNTGTSNVPAWAQVTLTSGVTGTLPVANGGTGITSLGSNVATFLGTPSSANLRSALTDETGSGAAVFGTSPTLVTPALGTPASGVLTNATGLPEAGLAVSNSPTNGYFLSAQSGDAGGMTWAASAGIAAVVDDTTPQVGGSAGFDLQAQLLVGNGGSTGIAISSAGEVTMAAQPSCVVPADAKSNISGDTTVYTIVWGTADIDRNGDFDDSSTFTCPVAGLYRFTANPGSSGYASGHTDTRLTVLGANFAAEVQVNGFNCKNNGTTLLSIPFTALIDCDASDTVTFTFQVGGGAKTIDLNVSPDGEMSVELAI